eukprot:9659806-Ditylum_brightwellii.AAC.1
MTNSVEATDCSSNEAKLQDEEPPWPSRFTSQLREGYKAHSLLISMAYASRLRNYPKLLIGW